MAQISEYSEAGITVRGTYYPPGKEPKEGDRKLYLAIESTNELAVSKARAEFIRLIKEELVKMVCIPFTFLIYAKYILMKVLYVNSSFSYPELLYSALSEIHSLRPMALRI